MQYIYFVCIDIIFHYKQLCVLKRQIPQCVRVVFIL